MSDRGVEDDGPPEPAARGADLSWRAEVPKRLSPGGQALAAGMFGLADAIYGERPRVEVVAEADADGLDLGDIDLDLDDPASSRMILDPDG